MPCVKPSQNDPCPCGSGLKFKKCCGRAAPTDAPPVAAVAPHARHCGTCTACCNGWLKINIHGHAVYPGRPCPYSTTQGCAIYEDRPHDPCRKFVCGWLEEGSPLPEDFRPDKTGVIFMTSTWRGIPIYGLVPAGRDPDAKLIEWMQTFARQTQRPFLYAQAGEWYAYGPVEFQQEMLAKLARGEKLWR